MRRSTLLATSAVMLALGCAKPERPVPPLSPPPAPTTNASAVPDTAPAAHETPSAALGMDCSTPRKTIESQYQAIVGGASLEVISRCFTSRLQDRITAEMLVKAKEELAGVTLDELYESERSSPNAVKVKAKNGRSLTTLVREGDVWKADTLWFK